MRGLRRAPIRRDTRPVRARDMALAPVRRLPISKASDEQREKVEGQRCAACHGRRRDSDGRLDVEPAHLVSRAQGGCDSALCVVPLCHFCHRDFDVRKLDLTPHLTGRYVPEVLHAVEHYDGDLTATLNRLSGRRWAPDNTQ